MNIKKRKVLIFPAGTEIGLEIRQALQLSKFVELYGGTSAADHSELVYSRLITGFPYVNEPGFLNYLNNIIRKYEIDCIYPAHDEVLLFLASHREDINALLIASETNTVKICRSKDKTYRYLKQYDFIPKTFLMEDEISKYPVFIKPDIGQGSVGAKVIYNKDELLIAKSANYPIVISEYLPGREFTVDCFTDKYGKLLSSKIRTRERTIKGISARSTSVHSTQRVLEIADVLNKELSFLGAWFFQAKEDAEGKIKLMEVSPRIPGTIGLSRNQGINYEMLTLFSFWGYDVTLADNSYDIMLDRSLKSVYKLQIQYEYVYLDYDDTLIVRDEVNTELMRFLYQCVNNKKRIILLSKHIGDLLGDMDKHKISRALFDKIITIGNEEEKADYIDHSNAIFIDDSYAERKKVRDRLKLNVFDLDMVEALLEYAN